MERIEEKVRALWGKDREGSRCLKELLEESRRSPAVAAYLGEFIQLMRDTGSSYRRTRGLLLIAANARWEEGDAIGPILGEYLTHITDEKPITARQCIQALPELAAGRPEFRPQIAQALRQADTSAYPDSMWPLVEKDIAAALQQIEG